MGLVLVYWAPLGAESIEGHGKGLKIVAHPNPHVLDGFGMSIAGHKKVILVGAPNEMDRGQEAGRAYLFDLRTEQFVREFGLPRPTSGALFGQSGALNGSSVVIGAPRGRDGGGTYTGGIYFFDQMTGKSTRTITNPNPVTGTFGHALAMDEQRVVVGDPQASTNKTYYTGAAYVFNVTTGERLHTLYPSTLTPGRPGRFGHAVALSSKMIFVGAPQEHTESMATGMVYGFDAVNGAHLRTFVNPDPGESFFGWSVAAEDDLVLIGGFGYQGRYREEGIAYLFHATSGKLIRAIQNPSPQDRAHFGKTVAILPNLLVVGAPGDIVSETGIQGGAIYLFDRLSGKFLKRVMNPAKPIGADDLFAGALARADEHLLVGAPFGGSGPELDAGLVYTFGLMGESVPGNSPHPPTIGTPPSP